MGNRNHFISDISRPTKVELRDLSCDIGLKIRCIRIGRTRKRPFQAIEVIEKKMAEIRHRPRRW